MMWTKCLLSKTFLYGLLAYFLLSLIGFSQAQEQTIYWPEKRDSGDVGVSADCFFYPVNKEPFSLEIWQWTGNTIKSAHSIQLDKELMSFSAAIYSPNKWICQLYDEELGTAFCLADPKSGKITNHWRYASGSVRLGRGSQNGKYVAAWDDKSFEKDIVRFGLVSADALSFAWAVTVQADGAQTWKITNSVVPSNNGQFIGVAGWEWGVLMIDVAQKKPIWEASCQYKPVMREASKKPKATWKEIPLDEVGTNDLAFTPDNKLIYAGGATGLLYGMKTDTGKIVSQWWASPSDKEEYGHRIRTVAVSPDGNYVAAGTVPNGLTYLFSTKDGHRYTIKDGRDVGIDLLSFSPDSKRLATYGAGKIKIWKIADVTTEPVSDRPEPDKQQAK
jgi:hypothetical protein